MSDSQLRQTISQLSHAASGAQYQAYAAPTPQRTSGRAIPPFFFFVAHKLLQCSLPEKHRKLVHIFNSSATHRLTTQPSSKKQQSCSYTRSCTRHALTRHSPTHPTTRLSTNTNTNDNGRPTASCTDRPTHRSSTRPTPNDSTSPPIDLRLASPNRRDAPHAAHPLRHVHRRSNYDSSGDIDASARRGGVVSYADPGSGDDIPDAGEVDSDGSDFVASGGTRTAIRAARGTLRVVNSTASYPAGGTPVAPLSARSQNRAGPELSGLDTARALHHRETLCADKARGLVTSVRFHFSPTHSLTIIVVLHSAEEKLAEQAQRSVALVPIRVEFETDTHRIRDCFVWNLHESLVTPEQFARTFCADLDLPPAPWADTVAAQIRAQLEDQDGVGSMELAVDGGGGESGDEIPECRVILSVRVFVSSHQSRLTLTLTYLPTQIDVQVDNHHLLDHIEWDLRSGLTPEEFTRQLCLDLGLAGEAEPLIAHAVHEELMKHKKDAIEWGVIGGFPMEQAASAEDGSKDKSALECHEGQDGSRAWLGPHAEGGEGPAYLEERVEGLGGSGGV
jgi:chromatin structure-remodeling complex subunit SFH1